MSRPLEIEEARALYPQSDLVHGFEHIQRVLALADHLAELEGADRAIVRAAALLHDAQDPVPSDNPAQRGSHHLASAELAERLLGERGWDTAQIAAVQHCIRAHRFRDDREPPATIEAKVLFDADKLDAIGATGVARAIAYACQAGKPYFAQPSQTFLETGQTLPGEPHSAYHEYLFKLRSIQNRLYTVAGQQIAARRHAAMASFFEQLAAEMNGLA